MGGGYSSGTLFSTLHALTGISAAKQESPPLREGFLVVLSNLVLKNPPAQYGEGIFYNHQSHLL
jgi:hypothetical protein